MSGSSHVAHREAPSYEAVRAAQSGYVYDRAPMLVYWELTRACDLACRHCRAEAVVNRDPDELTTDEARALLRQVLDFGPPLPHMVFTGGDPTNIHHLDRDEEFLIELPKSVQIVQLLTSHGRTG